MFSMWEKVSGAIMEKVKVKVEVRGKGTGGDVCRKGDGREEPARAQGRSAGRVSQWRRPGAPGRVVYAASVGMARRFFQSQYHAIQMQVS